MTELKNYYNKWREKLMLLSIPCWLILVLVFSCINDIFSRCLAYWVNNPNITYINQSNEMFFYSIFNLFLDFVAPTTITVILFSRCLNYINQKGWRKKFPQYDVSGEWLDMTRYTKSFDQNGWTELKQNNVPSPVRIKQTCQTIEVLPSTGKDFTWYSLSADWDDSNSLKILYEVEYYGHLREKGYPEKRIGYESMRICENGSDTGKQPHKMVGKFWHCICDDGKPIYMGDVEYKRKPDGHYEK
ncbi:MAG: hypothetical protein NC489_20435 [Ruminococcus flavefaciens]|nr:hypothetical protein [Ruminococcus flavefaciens]